MQFNEFDLHPDVAAGVEGAGFTAPTPIQAQAIPKVMKGCDVMGLAQTGTGKTAAFVLPILNRLMQGGRGHARALIIAPTRELAEQIHQAIESLGCHTGLRSAAIYGGVSINPQIKKLKQGVEIVVACPGRLLDHIGQKNINFSRLEVLTLDEADHMFDMGFLPDIRRILRHLPRHRQTLLFSATMPDEIRGLAKDILRSPVTVQVGTTAPAVTVSHALYPVARHLKRALLLKLLRQGDTGSVLVFTRTKHRAKRLGEQLARAGYRSTSLQGNLSQGRRQAALDGFRNGTYQVLVATDIAARGIDVSGISRVVNYDMPATADDYIHRIGRTGRADCSGDAFTLITDDDTNMVKAIDRILGSRIERRILEDFDYDIPEPSTSNRPARSSRKPAPRSRKPFGIKKGGAKQGAPASGRRRQQSGPGRGPGRAGARAASAPSKGVNPARW